MGASEQASLPFIPPSGALVISRPDRIGDAVISSSCLPSLREAFPKAELHYLVSSAVKPLFEKSELLTGVIELPDSPDPQQNLDVLCKHFYDLGVYGIIHLNHHPLVYRAAELTPLPLRIGWESPDDEPETLTHALSDLRYQGLKHEAEYNFDLLRFLGIQSPQKYEPHIHLDSSIFQSLKQKLPFPLDQPSSNWVAIHPSAAKDVKRWPAQRFAQLAQWAQKTLKLHVVSVGGSPKDAALAEFRELTSHLDIVRLEGNLSLAELAALFSKTKLLVTADSGPAHVASAVNCPQVVLFGRTEPRYGPNRWRPLSPRAILVATDCIPRTLETKKYFWKRCFESIALEKVQSAVEYALRL